MILIDDNSDSIRNLFYDLGKIHPNQLSALYKVIYRVLSQVNRAW